MWLGSLLEYSIRRVYFSLPRVEAWYQRYKPKRLARHAATVSCDLETFRRTLEDHIPPRVDIMLHSSMAGIGRNRPPVAWLELLREFCGAERTLLVPSHPRLRPGSDGIPEYDPRRAPSTIGLISELARRSPEFERSLHPISSMASSGPATRFYLDGNLNERKPLPHGVDSPYARFAERGGVAICLGVPFDKCLTMIHVAEETLDDGFPLAVVFEEVPMRVKVQESWTPCIVRRRSRRMIPHISMWSLRRDLVRIGAVRQVRPGGLLVDIVDCARVVAFMRERAAIDGYPYLFLSRRRSRTPFGRQSGSRA